MLISTSVLRHLRMTRVMKCVWQRPSIICCCWSHDLNVWLKQLFSACFAPSVHVAPVLPAWIMWPVGLLVASCLAGWKLIGQARLHLTSCFRKSKLATIRLKRVKSRSVCSDKTETSQISSEQDVINQPFWIFLTLLEQIEMFEDVTSEFKPVLSFLLHSSNHTLSNRWEMILVFMWEVAVTQNPLITPLFLIQSFPPSSSSSSSLLGSYQVVFPLEIKA